MSQAIRATVGLVVLSSTIVSFAYLVSKGNANERNIVQSAQVTSLKQEINEREVAMQLLVNQNSKLEAKQAATENSLNQASDYINSKNTYDLPSVYKRCIDSFVTLKPVEVLDKDYDKYSLILLNKTPLIKSYLNEVTPGYTKRYIQIISATPQTVNFEVNEITVLNIYPECKTTISPYAKFTYDITKGVVTAVN